ncbi:MAG TPA: flagellar assembly peptidoglycan hydrolase FlgJ [Pseudolabrys sp.]|nr:flagellar assembly peptidoglycan hydrolase FlgJ [Pseudolabrys sp.]
MATGIAMPPPGLSALDLMKAQSVAQTTSKSIAGKFSEGSKAKAKAASQDFEAVFLNSMFQQMFTSLQGEGPFGGSGATGVWRSFLTDEYSKSFAKAGGIGIANQVYSSLLQQQEAHQ